ncbi:hypothetical protein TSMEX_010465 [Taenia solium]|eukprot:TsM_001103400 transcript=TsM_001103400 gene=TsM_001103400
MYASVAGRLGLVSGAALWRNAKTDEDVVKGSSSTHQATGTGAVVSPVRNGVDDICETLFGAANTPFDN